MHTLFVLTVALGSLSPEWDASIPARLEGVPSWVLPGSQRGKSHLLDTNTDTSIDDRSDDEGEAGRIIVESLVGFGLGLTGMAVGSLALSDPPSTLELAVPLGLQVLGNSMGVSLTGWAMEGRGRFGFALLGSLLGLAVPLLGGTALVMLEGCEGTDLSSCSSAVPMIVGIFLLPTVGATLGYELSAPAPWLSHGYASRAGAPAPRLVPFVTLARQGLGATLGVAGSL